METTKFSSKPFVVDAVQVTEENFDDVVEWCGGDVRTQRATLIGDGEEDKRYIKVRVSRPLSEKQSQAFVGDWVLLNSNSRYKVYTDKAFNANFDPVFQSATN